MGFDMIQILPLLMVVSGAIKLNNYKSYGIKVSLKNGDFLEQKVPLKLKYEAVEFVNKIRKELFLLSASN